MRKGALTSPGQLKDFSDRLNVVDMMLFFKKKGRVNSFIFLFYVFFVRLLIVMCRGSAATAGNLL